MTTSQILLKQLKLVPDKPGVYVFKDVEGKVLYVGKGRSLKKRIRSYFQKTNADSPKITIMVQKISDFDFYITNSEVEALILECNLIKKYHPYFNVNLKDDKSYPSLAVTLADAFPRVMVTRMLGIEGAQYFGPYTSPRALRETLDTLRRIFPIRYCRGKEPGRTKGAPCLNYHIEKCLGPCTNNVNREDYRKMIDQICLFLEGKQEQVIVQLEQEMKEASKKLQYEKAARLRNRIQAAKQVLQKQKIVSQKKEDRDVIGFFSEQDYICIEVFFIRAGKMLGSKEFFLDKVGEVSDRDLLSSFVKQFYLKATFVPKSIILQVALEDQDTIEQWLTDRLDKRVAITVPMRGEKKKLVALAAENARAAYSFLRLKKDFQRERDLKALIELKEQLQLPVLPNRIEAFDISTIRGRKSVGSMVVFENGKPRKKEYRRFRIKSVKGQDDFAMMAEVLKRRFVRYLEEESVPKSRFGLKPDLVLVDGGKPQLSAALKSFRELKIGGVCAVALAKEEEEIFVPRQTRPIVLLPTSHALKLVQSIRDEAHRFAVEYHRSLRTKQLSESFLDEIPGIGEKRKRMLIKHFGSPKALFEARLQELEKVPNIPHKVIIELYGLMHHCRK